VHRPHSFDSDLSQMAESTPERKESMVSALPVLGLNIMPAMVGSWWIDWARWVYTGVQGGKEREARCGLLQRMAGRGEGLEKKMGTLGSGTGGGSRGTITGIGLMGVDRSILRKGTAAVLAVEGCGVGLMAQQRISATLA
jgi:hypothetical protein